MALPPFAPGAVNDTLACALPALAVPIVGAPGAPICTGSVRDVSVPSPSCPLLLSPHDQTVPSARSARLLELVPAAAPQVVTVPLCIGVVRVVTVPSPNWP